eukprot:1125088-Pyramimonas_sp.AAC.1
MAYTATNSSDRTGVGPERGGPCFHLPAGPRCTMSAFGLLDSDPQMRHEVLHPKFPLYPHRLLVHVHVCET